MVRLHTSFVLGYHGCSRLIGERIVAGDQSLAASEKDYDWLGPGVYFWEADAMRAWEWADSKVRRGEFAEPFVIGAAIDLGNCLDLMARESLEVLRRSYDLLEAVSAELGQSLPSNRGKDEDKLLRFLDCAVIRTLHNVTKTPFDTVRGLFTEGGPLFPGSGFSAKTHVQIAVCAPDCIKGYFRVARP